MGLVKASSEKDASGRSAPGGAGQACTDRKIGAVPTPRRVARPATTPQIVTAAAAPYPWPRPPPSQHPSRSARRPSRWRACARPSLHRAPPIRSPNRCRCAGRRHPASRTCWRGRIKASRSRRLRPLRACRRGPQPPRGASHACCRPAPMEGRRCRLAASAPGAPPINAGAAGCKPGARLTGGRNPASIGAGELASLNRRSRAETFPDHGGARCSRRAAPSTSRSGPIRARPRPKSGSLRRASSHPGCWPIALRDDAGEAGRQALLPRPLRRLRGQDCRRACGELKKLKIECLVMKAE